MYALIPLGCSEALARVDHADLPLVEGRRWSLLLHRWKRRKTTGYAQSTGNPPDAMHRTIMGLTRGDGLVVDHLNGNGLDNRRANLEVVTHSENVRRGHRHRRERAKAKSGVAS